MPANQRGSAQKERSGRWGARFYDEANHRHYKGGFATKTDALRWLDDQVREIRALRLGDKIPNAHRPQTVDALLDLFLDKHGRTVDQATERKLRTQLRKARTEFGDRHPDSIRRVEVEDWRATLPAGSRPDVFRAFRQALSWALARSLTERDATVGIKNPKRKRHERQEIVPFETWDEIEAICDELDPRYRAIPIFAAGTGLRPEEWIALERQDVDRDARLVHVRRRFSGGQLKQGGKTAGSVRSVPLRQRVLDALDAMPHRIDVPLLFPAPRGGHIDLERFRHREWTPALRAAGIPHRSIYSMRHTYATWTLEAGLSPIALAQMMGTSLRELEDTYYRQLLRSDEQTLAALDNYDANAASG